MILSLHRGNYLARHHTFNSGSKRKHCLTIKTKYHLLHCILHRHSFCSPLPFATIPIQPFLLSQPWHTLNRSARWFSSARESYPGCFFVVGIGIRGEEPVQSRRPKRLGARSDIFALCSCTMPKTGCNLTGKQLKMKQQCGGKKK